MEGVNGERDQQKHNPGKREEEGGHHLEWGVCDPGERVEGRHDPGERVERGHDPGEKGGGRA